MRGSPETGHLQNQSHGHSVNTGAQLYLFEWRSHARVCWVDCRGGRQGASGLPGVRDRKGNDSSCAALCLEVPRHRAGRHEHQVHLLHRPVTRDQLLMSHWTAKSLGESALLVRNELAVMNSK